MKKEWNESTWIIKGIFIFFILRGFIFLASLTIAIVALLKSGYPDKWGMFIAIIEEQDIYITSMIIGVVMWIMRLVGIYYSYLLLHRNKMARDILEYMTWIIVFFSIFYFVFTQYLGASHVSIFEKEPEYFISKEFIFGILIIFCDILVLAGLRNKSTHEFVLH